jgi:putative Holliday junction resolvase
MSMKVLAIDFGSKRIGLAVGDSRTRVATPLAQISAGNLIQALQEIARRVGEFEVGHIVVGYPLNMDGSRGPACRRVDRFIGQLQKAVALPVSRFDEKLSSVAAEEMAREIEPDFRKRKAFLDSIAANVILQAYFGQYA